MTRILIVDEDAAAEADAQVRYYLERAGERIALRFVAELEATYRALVDDRVIGVTHPGITFRLPVRRVLLDRFPFAVVFYIDGDTVLVVAIEALRKEPGYWRSR